MTSAYPIELTALTEQVKALAVELGELPSRNRIKTTFKVGAPKATAVLEALTADGFDPTSPDPVVSESTTRRLHAVPTRDTGPAPVVEPVAAVVVEATEPAPVVEVVPAPVIDAGTVVADVEVNPVVDPVPAVEQEASHGTEVPAGDASPEVAPALKPAARVRSWPLLLLAAGAFVAIWGGWVGLGEKAGFGLIRLLPGIADGFVINSAITLPIGVEAYAAYALRVWLSGASRSDKARRFAKWSAIGSLVLGAAGQVAYHLMQAAGIGQAPWWITTFVSCLPVVVLGCGAALTHLLHDDDSEAQR
ncbi:ABC transporter permease [Umezawaea sp. Da 62-37]|uniref:ABC transporter permease n=1 Tax=Umezawaea sp. Da 62-37 TaxID=3075927 RepID=UPI0028F6D37F|nr:ABC transporter permease [Umezawaea sp. Da 62-37]WNV90948.1 ABC transporter permease [Umezawaea sp. Da 62-37]